MPNLATVLKDEIGRLARKEIRAHSAVLKRQSALHRRTIAELKRNVSSLQREVSHLKRRERKQAKSPVAVSDATVPRFSPDWVAKHRTRLGISAADYASLVGVSALTIYNWESGKTKPRAAQLAAWGKIRGLGKREAFRLLEE